MLLELVEASCRPRRFLHLLILGLPHSLEPHVPIFLEPRISKREDNATVCKVFCVMVVVVLLDVLPAHVDDEIVVVSLDRLDDLAARHAYAPVHVADDVRPKRPGSHVPRFVGVDVNGGAAEGCAFTEGLAVGRELLDIGVASEGCGRGENEFAEDGLDAGVLLCLFEILMLRQMISHWS